MSKKSKILYLILFFLGLIGFVYWDVLAIKEVVDYGTRVYAVVLLGIVGLAICLFLGIVLHELGHMVFGLIGQMKFKSIQFPFVKFTEVNGKIKVSFALSSSFLGVCEMFPKMHGKPEKAFAFMAMGGPIGSLVMLLINVTFLILTPYISFLYGYLVVLFGLSAPISFVIFLENAFPMEVNGARTDGGQLREILKGTPSAKVMVAVLSVQSAYREGYTPSEINWVDLYALPQLPDEDPNYIFLLSSKYLYALDGGYSDLLKDADMRLRDVYGRLPDYFADQILSDLFFNSLYIAPNKEFVEQNKDKVFKLLEKEDNLSACRIRAYYFVSIGDYVTAFSEMQKGRNISELYPLEGLKKTELKLINELEYIISRESKKEVLGENIG